MWSLNVASLAAIFAALMVNAQEEKLEKPEKPELGFAVYQKDFPGVVRIDTRIDDAAWKDTSCVKPAGDLPIGSVTTSRYDGSPDGPVDQEYCIYAFDVTDCSKVIKTYPINPKADGDKQDITFDTAWAAIDIRKGSCPAESSFDFEPKPAEIFWQPRRTIDDAQAPKVTGADPAEAVRPAVPPAPISAD